MHESPRVSPLFMIVTALFVTCLLTANIVAVKLILVGPWVAPAGVVIFPVAYIFGDILTEVWGFGRARQVIWLGFACNAVMVAAIWVAQQLPPAGFVPGQEGVQPAYERILGFTPRLLLASFCAYLVGEFANSFVLAKVKIATGGRWLWTRTIASTIVGQALDSLIFIAVAFGWGPATPEIVLTQWLLKSAYEIVATPVTYAIVGLCKRVEGVDTFDVGTNFNPLRLAS